MRRAAACASAVWRCECGVAMQSPREWCVWGQGICVLASLAQEEGLARVTSVLAAGRHADGGRRRPETAERARAPTAITHSWDSHNSRTKDRTHQQQQLQRALMQLAGGGGSGSGRLVAASRRSSAASRRAHSGQQQTTTCRRPLRVNAVLATPQASTAVAQEISSLKKCALITAVKTP